MRAAGVLTVAVGLRVGSRSWGSGVVEPCCTACVALRRWKGRSRREAPSDLEDSECRGAEVSRQRAHKSLAQVGCWVEETSSAKHVGWTGRQKSWMGELWRESVLKARGPRVGTRAPEGS